MEHERAGSKIWEALLSALPITAIVYILALTPWFHQNATELITFSVGAVLLVLGIGLFNLGAFFVIAVLRIVFHRTLSNILMLFYMLLFALALLLSVNGKLNLQPMAFVSGGIATGPMTSCFILPLAVGACVGVQSADAVLRDAILNALYKQMGMGKKAHGIAFSLPVSDVAGLVKEPEPVQD